MLQIAICDDNLLDAQNVERKVSQLLNMKHVPFRCSLYHTPAALLSDALLPSIDVIFLDIDMPEKSGMDIAEICNQQEYHAEIIFVTNHDELVYKAYRFKALGFVRKKHLFDELSEAIDVLLETLQRKETHIQMMIDGVSQKVKISEILYLQSNDHYIDVFFADRKALVRENIKNMEQLLSKHGFIRIHTRYLVNYRYIFSIDRTVVTLDNHVQLPISRSNKAKTKELFQYFSRGI